MRFNNGVAFILTNLAFQALIGHFGVYAIMKYPMASLFEYDEYFLGVLDAFQIIGQIVGSLLILFLTIKPVKGYLWSSIINFLFSLLMLIPRHIGYVPVRDFTVFICLFIQALSSAALAYTQVIFSFYYNQNANKCYHSLWYSITFLGDISSLIFASIAIECWSISWEITNLIWKIYIVIIGILMYKELNDQGQKLDELNQILMNQNDLHEENSEKQQIKKDQHHQKCVEEKNDQKISNSELCKLLTIKIVNTLKQMNVVLVVLSSGLMESLYFSLLLWVPYYYIIIGLEAYSTTFMLGISISISLGGVLMQVILFVILKLEHWNKQIIYSLLLLSSVIYLIMWYKRSSDHLTQLVLLFIGNFLLACPFSRISASDPVEQAKGDQHKIKTIFLLCHTFRNSCTAVFSVVIGFFMKIDRMSFWTFIIINLFMIVIIETVRKIILKQKFKKNSLSKSHQQIQMIKINEKV